MTDLTPPTAVEARAASEGFRKALAAENARAGWETAESDPKLIRSYDHPVDGRYFLGADIVAWLRDLAGVARDGDPIAAAFHGPFLDRMAETVERWLTSETEER